MKKMVLTIFVLTLGLPAFALEGQKKCGNIELKGQYVFTALGFQRPSNSPAGTPWVPKGILQILDFNGEGRVTTPVVTIANPPFPSMDLGSVTSLPGGGSPGEYWFDDDCHGTIRFFDAINVTFKFVLDQPKGDIWMIQTNPANNVFQGIAKRLDQ